MKPNKNRKDEGFVFVSIILLTAILEGYAATSLIGQLRDIRMAQYNQMKLASMYAAQGAMEQGLARLADRIANFDVASILPDTDYVVNYADGRTTATYRIRCAPPTVASTPLANCPVYMLAEGGVNKAAQDFEVVASAANPDNTGMATTASSRIHQIAALKQTNIFAYSIFYNSDLEVLPGPNMTMTGQIHANGSIYMGSNATLTLDSNYVHATGDIYRHRKDSSQTYGDTAIRIRKDGTSGACGSSTCPYVTFDNMATTNASLSTSTWNGSVQGVGHGVGFVQPVTIPSIQPGGFYYNNAGLRIIYDPSTGTQVYQRGAGGSYTNITTSLNANCPGAVTQRQFRNNRENSNYDVVVTEVDVSKINGTACSTNYFPSNGLIYTSRTDAQPAAGQFSATSHGIRLINGSQATPTGSSTGLTVVSNDPLYVKGDFNTVNRKSVALISDSMNILSNNWLDSNPNNLSSRVAANSTVNAGFVSGIVPTAGSQYSGGFENYPRFLENWTNQTVTIGGAFINLWNSSIGNGQWVYGGNQYTAPNRTWAYDSGLQSSPPPFTPVGVEVTTKTWWQEAKESIYL